MDLVQRKLYMEIWTLYGQIRVIKYSGLYILIVLQSPCLEVIFSRVIDYSGKNAGTIKK